MLLTAARRSSSLGPSSSTRPAALLAMRAHARRGLANKVFDSAEAAVKDIKDGSKL
jgi:hypothetical protein